jgi:hypothetical protein
VFTTLAKTSGIPPVLDRAGVAARKKCSKALFSGGAITIFL